ncbi:hypothetical protein EYF80_043469 [Liparis tanakae]|uniref:Uncharacterized protein n=1 Tax=Liparis tanakae TaxID=230148 RepID=A0A4Z2FZL3_9TELE|nr:hypothetical protein EYF80_043469 [Liparis tanakae]
MEQVTGPLAGLTHHLLGVIVGLAVKSVQSNSLGAKPSDRDCFSLTVKFEKPRGPEGPWTYLVTLKVSSSL